MSHRGMRNPGPAADGVGQHFEGAMARHTTINSLVELGDPDLHADSEGLCSACGATIRPGWVIRVTPHGTRHDVCP